MEVVRLPPEIKPLLPRTLTFVPARLTAPAQALTPLKSSPLLVVSPAVSKEADPNQLQLPRESLFPAEQVAALMTWKSVRTIGPGLRNMGNTCFLNSVLQCLTYTPPLANLCLERAHSAVCRAPNGCVFCLLEAHLRRALSGSAGSTLTPREFVANLRAIGRHFRAGRQEDSHEFLRYLVEALQRASLRGLPPEQLRASPRLAETSVVHSIFGGYLRSQVKCAACTYESNTFDPFLDLSLELEGQPSVPRALQAFTAPERLDAENQYRCERCRRLSRATKRLSIHRAPAVLTMQLKRFKAGPFGNFKISKFVEYPDRLSLAEYMSPQQERPPEPRADGPWYRLYAVLVHEGASTRSGHYYCFVKNSNGVWYMMNDDAVHQVSLATVLRQQAYVLFYIRESPLQSPSPPLSTTTATTATPSPAPRPALVSRLDPAAPSAKAKAREAQPMNFHEANEVAAAAYRSTSTSKSAAMLDTSGDSSSSPSSSDVEPALRLANGVAKRRREASHEAEQELQQAKEQQWDRKRSKQERVREALLKLPAKARLEREKRLRDEAPPAPSENAKATPHFRSSSSIDTEPSELEPEPEPTPEPEAVPVVKKARVPRETPVLLPVRDPQAREEWVRSLRSAPPGANSHLGVEVESWTRGSGEAAEELLERARSEAQRALLPECRLRDIWDMEYDKGKAKKRKQKREIMPSSVNLFDSFNKHRRKFFAKGKRNRDSFASARKPKKRHFVN